MAIENLIERAYKNAFPRLGRYGWDDMQINNNNIRIETSEKAYDDGGYIWMQQHADGSMETEGGDDRYEKEFLKMCKELRKTIKGVKDITIGITRD